MACGECGKWWMARTNLEKTLLSFSSILLLTFIIINLVGIVHHGGTSEETVESRTCSSSFCVEKARSMASMVDFSVDPCEDFYEFACGQYVKTHGIPTDYQEASVEHDAVDAVYLELRNWLLSDTGSNISVYRKAKTLYKTCLNYDQAHEDAHAILEKAMVEQQFGRWSVLDSSWKESYVGLERSLASMALLGVPVVFQLDVLPDSNNPGRYVTQLSPGSPFLNADQLDVMKSDMFFHYVEATLLLLGVEKAHLTSIVDEILSTEAKMISLREYADELCGESPAQDLTEKGVDSFMEVENEMYSNVKWSQVLSYLFSALDNSTLQDFKINLYCKRYIREFNDYFYYSNNKTINTYFGWRFFSSIMDYLGPTFHELVTSYKHYMSSAGEPFLHRSRWKECIGLLEKEMLPVLANVYEEQALNEPLMKQKMRMAEAVRLNLGKMLTSADWLPAADKTRMKQEVKDSKFEIAFARMFSNVNKLEELFSELSLENDHLVNNVLRCKRFTVLKNLKKLISPQEQHLEWKHKSLTSMMNAQNHGNRFVVFYDKLRPPYLSLDQQSYLNYGAFGTFLAGQLYHYLATPMSTQSKRSNDTLWSSYLRNHKPNSCSSAGVHFPNSDQEPNINQGKWDELLNQRAAIEVAYKSYKEQAAAEHLLPGLNLTNDQLFFLSYAQTKCEVRRENSSGNSNEVASKLSVNFALKHFGGFSEAFSCKGNAPMNPAKKCSLWN